MYVYRIDIGNNCYFGITETLRERELRHKRELEQNIHHNIILQRLYNKYKQFSFTPLLEVQDREEAESIEQRLIETHDCVNLTSGGDGGDTISNHPNRSEIVARVKKTKATIDIQYSSQFKSMQGRIADHAEKVWGTFHCNKCDRDIKGKTNFLRYHGENCGKQQPLLKCPHCKKEGRGGGMYNRHFDKCKRKLNDRENCSSDSTLCEGSV